MSECGTLSQRYLCLECSETAQLATRRQLIAHSGPAFEHWRRGVAAAVGAVLWRDLEDADEQVDSAA